MISQSICTWSSLFPSYEFDIPGSVFVKEEGRGIPSRSLIVDSSCDDDEVRQKKKKKCKTFLYSFWSLSLKINFIYTNLWCRSLRARYICIVAVQHRHSGKIDLQFFFSFQSWQQWEISVYELPVCCKPLVMKLRHIDCMYILALCTVDHILENSIIYHNWT
jgi:hypothetical protein